MSDPWRPTG